MENAWLERESERLAIVGDYPFDDDKLRSQLDGLAQLAARSCGAPIGIVSIMGADRQVFIGRSGISAMGTARKHSFCAHTMYQHGCLVVPDATRDERFSTSPLVTGGPRIRFYAGCPLFSPEGAPLGSFCVIDTRPREEFGRDRQRSLTLLAQAASVLIEKWRAERLSLDLADRTFSRQAELRQQFKVLADVLPQMVWSTRDDGWSDYFNRKWCEYTGASEERSFGFGWLDFLHPDDVPAARAAWERAVQTGEDYETRYRMRRPDGEYRWVIARGVPMRDLSGAVSRWIGTCTDVQDEVSNAEKLEMLSQELSHRIKNIFAVIGGLVSMTRRNNPDIKPVVDQLQARILSLGRAHDLVRLQPRTAGEPGTGSLLRMLTAVLDPYLDAERPGIRIEGDDLAVDDRSATPFALIFHELATNAMKYGALSSEGGTVILRITEQSPEDSETAELQWIEQGGPEVVTPAEAGFGFRLISMAAGQLGGELATEWRSEGLRETIRVPRRNLVRG